MWVDGGLQLGTVHLERSESYKKTFLKQTGGIESGPVFEDLDYTKRIRNLIGNIENNAMKYNNTIRLNSVFEK